MEELLRRYLKQLNSFMSAFVQTDMNKSSHRRGQVCGPLPNKSADSIRQVLTSAEGEKGQARIEYVIAAILIAIAVVLEL